MRQFYISLFKAFFYAWFQSENPFDALDNCCWKLIVCINSGEYVFGALLKSIQAANIIEAVNCVHIEEMMATSRSNADVPFVQLTCAFVHAT